MRLTLILLFTTLLSGQEYTLGPDSQPQPGPKGTVTKYKLEPGKIYPGTPHNYSIYVPAQYDASKPTPFMIFLDGSGAAGNGQRVPVVFDNLIAKKELPPLIGIFIDPGVLPALSDKAMSRYGRIYEYDSIDGRFASFLETEMIPEVAKKYNLSKNPDDHAIAGVSTGAVGAFAAAWARPDLFHRVLSFIGTFVGMKGADTFPDMIRRTEPKPLRVFLQAGKNDHIVPGQPYGVFYGGSWPINNQLMYEAFQFSGYDVKFVLGESNHSMVHGSAIMPEAVRWLWRDYPKPITVHEPDQMNKPGWEPRGQVFSVVSVDKPWQQVGETYKSVTSPTYGMGDRVFFADPASNRVYQMDSSGKVSVFKENSNAAMALRVGADDHLYASQPAKHQIVSYGANGDEKVVARGVDASDLALTAKGEIYYTDLGKKTIGYIDAKGAKRIVYSGGEIESPSALTLSPDQSLVAVADRLTRYSWSFQIDKDGTLINGEPFFRVDVPETPGPAGATSVTVDSIGQVYFATGLGIQMCEQNGRCAAILARPEPAVALTGIGFLGADRNWLYASSGTKLFRRPVKVKGVAPGTPVTPPRPPL